MIITLSRAKVDHLVIGYLRKRYPGALAVTIDYEPRTDAGFCCINWAQGDRPKPIPKVRHKPRKGPMRDPEYRKWLRERLCAVACEWTRAKDKCIAPPNDPSHTENNGMRSKGPDSSCVPLCRKHHEEYDKGRALRSKRNTG